MNKVLYSNGEVHEFTVLTSSKISQIQSTIKTCYPDLLLTLFGCTYKADAYVDSYLANLDDSSIRTRTVVLLTVIERGPLKECYSNYLSSCRDRNFPVVILLLKYDPGLYNCWNYSIRISSTEYLGNANPDDVRFPMHDKVCIETLENEGSDLVATSLYFATSYCRFSDRNTYDECGVGFLDSPTSPVLTDLFSIEGDSVRPNNIFHCMPIWRRSLHDVCGYFNEDRYGTYADWALWLQYLSDLSAKASFANIILGVYLVAPYSHNRTYSNLSVFAKNIFLDLLLPVIDSRDGGESGDKATSKIACDIVSDHYGSHRSDFNVFAADVAAALQSSGTLNISEGETYRKLKIIPFIEKYFGWGCTPGEASSNNPQPISEPWVGLIHVPFDYPCFIEPIISPKNIFQSRLFRASLPNLRYLIFLSESMRSRYSQLYPYSNIPTCSIKFYTNHGEPFRVFDWSLFEKHQRVLHVGDWLRCFRSFYALDCDYQKIIIMKESTSKYMKQLSEYLYNGDEWLDEPVGSLQVESLVSSLEYDNLLCSSVIFVRLFDTSANNLVTECIDRCTPIVINRLPAAEEYLGSQYPLFYDRLEEAEALLRNMPLLHEGHLYLSELRLNQSLKRENEAILRIASELMSKTFDFKGFIF